MTLYVFFLNLFFPLIISKLIESRKHFFFHFFGMASTLSEEFSKCEVMAFKGYIAACIKSSGFHSYVPKSEKTSLHELGGGSGR